MNAPEATDKVHSQKLIIMSASMLLVAAGIFGGFFYLQRQAGSTDSAPLPVTREEAMKMVAEKRGMIYDHRSKSIRYADLTPDEQTAFVAKLRLIREKWRPWAYRNQAMLKRMLNAPAGDQATLLETRASLPDDAKERGIPGRLLIPTKNVMSGLKTRVPMFTWQPVGNRKGIDIPERMRAKYERSQESENKIIQSDFAQMRDIRLSRSINQGGPIFSLWASGRITKSNLVRRSWPEVRSGQRVTVSTTEEGPQEEVLPPFDFLR